MSDTIYLPDTSDLIAAWIEHYPQELFPNVWQFMDSLNGRLKVCEEVRTEIEGHASDLLDWIKPKSTERLALGLLQ